MRRCASRKKSSRVDDLGGLVEGLVVDEDRAEHALLGFEIVREGAIHGQMTTKLKSKPMTRLQSNAVDLRAGDDLDLELRRHVAVQLHRHLVLAERLERIGS